MAKIQLNETEVNVLIAHYSDIEKSIKTDQMNLINLGISKEQRDILNKTYDQQLIDLDSRCTYINSAI